MGWEGVGWGGMGGGRRHCFALLCVATIARFPVTPTHMVLVQLHHRGAPSKGPTQRTVRTFDRGASMGCQPLHRSLHVQWRGGCTPTATTASTATKETQHQMQRAPLVDVVVGQGAVVLQLLAREDEALGVHANPGGALDGLLHNLDRVPEFHVQGQRALRRHYHKNAHGAGRRA